MLEKNADTLASISAGDVDAGLFPNLNTHSSAKSLEKPDASIWSIMGIAWTAKG